MWSKATPEHAFPSRVRARRSRDVTDYLGGVKVYRTPRRWHEPDSGQAFEIELPDPAGLLKARDEYFEASEPAEK